MKQYFTTQTNKGFDNRNEFGSNGDKFKKAHETFFNNLKPFFQINNAIVCGDFNDEYPGAFERDH